MFLAQNFFPDLFKLFNRDLPFPNFEVLERVCKQDRQNDPGLELLLPTMRDQPEWHQEKGAMLTAANMHVAKKSMSTLFRNACCIIDMHVA